MQRFLLAYDGSESARRALALTSDLARRYGAEVAVISVAEYGDGGASRQEAEGNARRLAEEGTAALRQEGVPSTVVVRIGDPATEILRAVDEERCAMVVMGHRGMTPSRIWVLGSVALKVINYASCPVLVVRSGGLTGGAPL